MHDFYCHHCCFQGDIFFLRRSGRRRGEAMSCWSTNVGSGGRERMGLWALLSFSCLLFYRAGLGRVGLGALPWARSGWAGFLFYTLGSTRSLFSPQVRDWEKYVAVPHTIKWIMLPRSHGGKDERKRSDFRRGIALISFSFLLPLSPPNSEARISPNFISC